MKTFRLPLHKIVIKPNVVRGCNLELVAAIAHTLRTTHHDVEPVPVSRVNTDGIHELREGRHRYLASIIAGRSDILAYADPEG